VNYFAAPSPQFPHLPFQISQRIFRPTSRNPRTRRLLPANKLEKSFVIGLAVDSLKNGLQGSAIGVCRRTSDRGGYEDDSYTAPCIFGRFLLALRNQH
jgi:hypothetical protein